jgi:hypothetical protein
MGKTVRPPEPSAASPTTGCQLSDAVFAAAAEAVIDTLAHRWTAWRAELGFDEKGAQ